LRFEKKNNLKNESKKITIIPNLKDKKNHKGLKLKKEHYNFIDYS
jgi:hypothetical protein